MLVPQLSVYARRARKLLIALQHACQVIYARRWDRFPRPQGEGQGEGFPDGLSLTPPEETRRYGGKFTAPGVPPSCALAAQLVATLLLLAGDSSDSDGPLPSGVFGQGGTARSSSS